VTRVSRELVLVALTFVASSPVAAQVLEVPPRQMRPPQTSQTRATQELKLSVNLLGGYDDSLNPMGGVAPVGSVFVATPRPSGFLGLADTGLVYNRVSAARSFNGSSRGYMNAYQHSGTGATYGGEVNVNATTALGRRNRLSVFENFQNAPYYSLGLLGVPGGVGGNPTLAYTNGRNWTLGAGAAVSREWSRTTRTSLTYGFSRVGYSSISVSGVSQGQVGPFQNQSHTGTLDLTRSLARRFSLRVSARHVQSDFIQAGAGFRPVTQDGADGGMSYSRDLSRTRRMSLTAGGGMTYVASSSYLDSAAYHYWTPLFYGSTAFDLARSWSLTSTYRRSVAVPTVLRAIAPDAFVTHTLDLGAGGNVSNRVELALTAAYTDAETGAVAFGTDLARYRAYTGTAQVAVRLTDWWAAMVNVGHVEMRMNDAATQVFQTLPQLQRTQVRVGLSWQFPLVGDQRRRN
jgi:hypothetical protein